MINKQFQIIPYLLIIEMKTRASKKRNYRQFAGNQLIQPTLFQFGFDTVDQKHKRNLRDMLLEAKNDFQDCLVRLEKCSNNFDRGLQLLNDEENER